MAVSRLISPQQLALRWCAAGLAGALLSGCGTVVAGSQPGSSVTPGSAADNAAATSAVPPGGEGDILQTVPVEEQEELDPVPTGEPVEIPAERVLVDVQLSRSRSESRGIPGEVAGDAAQVSITLSLPPGGQSADLSGLSVSMEDASGRPLPPVHGAASDPLEGELAPGEVATGTYLFSAADEVRNPLTISVNLLADQPVAQFTGNLQ